MVKWFAYIVLMLIVAPALSHAKPIGPDHTFFNYDNSMPVHSSTLADTVATKNNKRQDPDDKKKIKEIAKAKRQPKPEKIVPGETPAVVPKAKPKRQRRPEGLERPPEIPRRNGD